jgi:predicted RNase H-like nuclease
MTTFKIPPPRITEFINDIKRLNVRHKPFSAYIPQGYYEIELYPNPNELFLKIKYK